MSLLGDAMSTGKKTPPLIHWKSVGHRLRELRGFYTTQAEFAKRIGVSQGFLSYVEHGEKELGAEPLLRIAREFGKTIEWILTGKSQTGVTARRHGRHRHKMANLV
jgi:transcriptional regulator with XRE-family HTH domain